MVITNEVHPVVNLEIRRDRIIPPVLDEEREYIIHAFGIVLPDTNLIADDINEMK